MIHHATLPLVVSIETIRWRESKRTSQQDMPDKETSRNPRCVYRRNAIHRQMCLTQREIGRNWLHKSANCRCVCLRTIRIYLYIYIKFLAEAVNCWSCNLSSVNLLPSVCVCTRQGQTCQSHSCGSASGARALIADAVDADPLRSLLESAASPADRLRSARWIGYIHLREHGISMCQ